MTAGETTGDHRFDGDRAVGRHRTGAHPGDTAGDIRDIPEPASLDRTERHRLTVVRRFGTTGSLLLGFGAIGAGAAPVDNPLSGVRLIGLPARMPTVAMAFAWLGMLMLVAGWLWLGKLSWPGRARMISRAQFDRTVVMWALPLAIAPPLFSRDMYAYLAQSEIAARGIDPYVLGPAAALGVDHPFTANVPNIWRDTPAPYGPGFLMLGRIIATIVGDNVVAGVLLWRAVMLAGLALAVWAISRLARRCGIQPVSALWLSVANPLVLFHVVSGMHNEALLMGIMLAGIELGLRWRHLLGTIVAAIVIVIAGAIKPPAFVALGFFGIYLVHRRGGKYSDLVRVALLLTVIFLAAMTVITVASGWGLGWLETFDVPNRIKTWLAPVTALGMTGAGIGMILGLGNHTEAMLVITKFVGYGISAVVCLRLLWVSFRGRIEPLAGLGITLGAVALLGPVLHPWYLLWALPPLALSTGNNRFRIAAAAISAFVALVVPPTGAAYVLRGYMIPFAVIAALIAFAVTLLLVRGKVPPLLPPRKSVPPITS
ncbi:alpha-1,6-mannosyltransferase [Halopolyspora algeriensis]|uniref:Alpha-1,6-mannosyltransferase n=1 Tax=Halopolyspora algeriensis TaxID=1500506 RepID=A0A368VIC2_9ACTN|nr:polyprenol phosphomannose-dependent alpha 1,6 mannosyltransferase MptB [Halopolyspora algeriensis]RCW40414.1 alpha-1,6-mannosyltransferase [Halopolyspora algeriensis]TQM53697.1 alpha-1,6-mannosyltransferase [Halopolyspora algeriensis]